MKPGSVNPLLRAGVFLAFALATTLTVAVLGRGFDFAKQAALAQQRYGATGFQTLIMWRDTLAGIQDGHETEKIRRVNDFFNRRIYFVDDIEAWGQKDYWATPLETMGQAKGDCEDFAIAKYFSLLILNVPADRLRMTYVKARIGGPHSTVYQAHMVLSYYADPTAEPLILDNLLNDIRPASNRPDLTPIFSFNSEGLWVGTSASGTNTKPNASSTARLSQWRNVLARMQADGFQ